MTDKARVFNRARIFAINAHGNQMYNEHLYVFHLDAVVDVLWEFGATDRFLTDAGFLHDVLKDTDASQQTLIVEFGERVFSLVWAVTNEKGYPNRAARHVVTYQKIQHCCNAVILKMADRIANVRVSVATGNKLDMYMKEYAGFREMILHSPVVYTNAFNAMLLTLDQLHGI